MAAEPDPSPHPRPKPIDTAKAYHIDLRIARDGLHLGLSGELDRRAVEPLRAVLASLELLDQPVHVDTAQVTLVDADGLAPLWHAARRRGVHAPLIVTTRSPAVQALMTDLGMPDDPGGCDPGAREQATRPARQPSGRSHGHVRLIDPPGELAATTAPSR